MGHYEGNCIRCGECCKTDAQWLYFDSEEKKIDLIQWSIARGYEVIQAGTDTLQVLTGNVCPELSIIEGKYSCNLQADKPRNCINFPRALTAIPGMNMNKVLPQGCGFKWKE